MKKDIKKETHVRYIAEGSKLRKITAAWALIQIFSALNADSLAIIAAQTLVIEFEIDGFKQDVIEMNLRILVGDRIQIIFAQNDFLDASNTRRFNELEADMRSKATGEDFAAAIAAETEFDTDVGLQIDEFSMIDEMGFESERFERSAFPEIGKVLVDFLDRNLRSYRKILTETKA